MSRSTAFSFDKLKYVSDMDKHCVSGYMRQVSALYNILTIPDLIMSICLAYYMTIDYFNTTKHSDLFRYDDNDTTVTYIKKDFESWSLPCIGTLCMNSMEELIIT